MRIIKIVIGIFLVTVVLQLMAPFILRFIEGNFGVSNIGNVEFPK